MGHKVNTKELKRKEINYQWVLKWAGSAKMQGKPVLIRRFSGQAFLPNILMNARVIRRSNKAIP